MVIRNDDVNPNTDFESLSDQYSIIREFDKNIELWSCFNFFSKYANGCVYPDLPLKEKPVPYFFGVDESLDLSNLHPVDSQIVSHGLWHFDHSKVSYDLQEASILTSCSLLKTDVFVPPFNHWNEFTDKICIEHEIRLAKPEEGWKSFEHNKFDPKHNLWYFHSWKWTPEQLKEYLNDGYKNS